MSRRLAPVALFPLSVVLLAACSAAAGEPRATATPNSGNLDGGYPELSIVLPEPDAIEVSLEDPNARAWLLTIAGAGDGRADRLEIYVETGDVTLMVEMREVRDGVAVDTVDLAGLDGVAGGAAGGCHGTLPVCISSDGVTFAADGSGIVSITLELPESAPLVITGATAGWPGEPFVLGPWTQTEPFPWPQG
jgi:hypothetical protein